MPDTKQALKAVCSFKDEYLLDFINVEELNEQEEDLDENIVEKAIVANVKKFIMTFGQDFSFIGNQYRIEVAGEEMFIDLGFLLKHDCNDKKADIYIFNKLYPHISKMLQNIVGLKG